MRLAHPLSLLLTSTLVSTLPISPLTSTPASSLASSISPFALSARTPGPYPNLNGSITLSARQKLQEIGIDENENTNQVSPAGSGRDNVQDINYDRRGLAARQSDGQTQNGKTGDGQARTPVSASGDGGNTSGRDDVQKIGYDGFAKRQKISPDSTSRIQSTGTDGENVSAGDGESQKTGYRLTRREPRTNYTLAVRQSNSQHAGGDGPETPVSGNDGVQQVSTGDRIVQEISHDRLAKRQKVSADDILVIPSGGSDPTTKTPTGDTIASKPGYTLTRRGGGADNSNNSGQDNTSNSGKDTPSETKSAMSTASSTTTSSGKSQSSKTSSSHDRLARRNTGGGVGNPTTSTNNGLNNLTGGGDNNVPTGNGLENLSGTGGGSKFLAARQAQEIGGGTNQGQDQNQQQTSGGGNQPATNSQRLKDISLDGGN
ncbi:hypothetical protein H2198_000561 [Neophaeococcomyces mojaviensis]|uniref:Uncharacterized protein n=1 Tax=Neophaeococcomyces mojaviensis TaxID=3383035 RepID=A0ACC3AJS1_9EURO|nr:hypothetical protein H2198_000561 [Knufia sp. JES_112]